MQTVSLELSKALFEKGLKIKTEKWWEGGKVRYTGRRTKGHWYVRNKETAIPAPSTDELLAVMPQYIYDRQNMLTIVKDDNETYWGGYSNHKGIAYKKKFSDESLPEALGKMCLWLLDNGYR